LLNVDNFAHVGGLLAGLWLGFVLPPSQVQTLASAWQAPRSPRSPRQVLVLRLVGVAALVAVVGGVVAYGTAQWQQDPFYRQYWSGSAVTHTTGVVAVEQAPVADIVVVGAR
jgi:hypothetical protein